MMLARLLPLALVAGLLTGAHVQAAACCLSSSAFGIGRLAPWEKWALVANASTSPVAGRWDGEGAWRANPEGISENEGRGQLSGLVSLHERLQLSARLPLVLTQREIMDQRASGGGLGDSQLALRYEPVFQGEYEPFPEVSLTAGVVVPSGRLADANSAPEALGTEVTGRGAWVLSAAFSVEVARANWFVQAGGGLTYPLAMSVPGGPVQQFGLGYQATLAGGAEVYHDLVLSLVVRYGFEGAIRSQVLDPQSGLPVSSALQELPGSQAYDVGGGPNLSYKLNPQWTVQGGVDLGLFANGLGTNRQGRTTATLGVRYAYF